MTPTTTRVPSLEQTYYVGRTLQLYSHPSPPLYTNKRCAYGNEPRLPEVADRYAKSIHERIALPPTAPDLTITLKKRFHSSMHNITHAWDVHVHNTSQSHYPLDLVAKIYDPVWFGESGYIDPFKLRNRSVSQEIESYCLLKPLQGTRVPQFYGHFVTSLSEQCERTVNVILMEHVEGDDLRHLVPSDNARAVCDEHRNAVIEAVLRLSFDVHGHGVYSMDFKPRNVMMRLPKQGRGTQYCSSLECPLRFEVDCEDLHPVMVDFERVEYHRRQDFEWGQDSMLEERLQRVKAYYLNQWLENYM